MNVVFKALSDLTRRQVLQLLRKGPLSAGELSSQFNVSKPTISAPFAVLKEADLVLVASLARKAPDRASYLRRPDLGPRLAPEAAAKLASPAAPAGAVVPALVVVMADGLSATA